MSSFWKPKKQNICSTSNSASLNRPKPGVFFPLLRIVFITLCEMIPIKKSWLKSISVCDNVFPCQIIWWSSNNSHAIKCSASVINQRDPEISLCRKQANINILQGVLEVIRKLVLVLFTFHHHHYLLSCEFGVILLVAFRKRRSSAHTLRF